MWFFGHVFFRGLSKNKAIIVSSMESLSCENHRFVENKLRTSFTTMVGAEAAVRNAQDATIGNWVQEGSLLRESKEQYAKRVES